MINKARVTIRHTYISLHGCVTMVIESSRNDPYAAVLCSSRLALKKNPGMLNRYKPV